jgi:hypothetical protein
VVVESLAVLDVTLALRCAQPAIDKAAATAAAMLRIFLGSIMMNSVVETRC